MTTTVPEFYRISEAAKILGPGAPSEDTLRREIKKGNLRAKRIGRVLRVTDVELRRWALDTDDTSSPPTSPTGSAAGAETVPPRPSARTGGGRSDRRDGEN